jgi:hypothetical protein
MEAILLKLVDQIPVAVLFLIAAGYAINNFQKFITKRDEQWQAFLMQQEIINDKRIAERDKQREADRQSTAAVIAEISRLTAGVTEFRKDFDRAVVRMEERTRPRPPSKE